MYRLWRMKRKVCRALRIGEVGRIKRWEDFADIVCTRDCPETLTDIREIQKEFLRVSKKTKVFDNPFEFCKGAIYNAQDVKDWSNDEIWNTIQRRLMRFSDRMYWYGWMVCASLLEQIEIRLMTEE